MAFMPSSAAKQQPSETMSKPEVCEYLGKSKRTVETFISKGRLGVGYFQGPNGKTAVFKRSEVEALKVDIDTPMYRAVPAHDTVIPGSMALVPTPAADSRVDSFAAALFAHFEAGRLSAPVLKPWLTLKEAADYSGLPKRWLLKQARAGIYLEHGSLNVGTEKNPEWRFNRDALGEK